MAASVYCTGVKAIQYLSPAFIIELDDPVDQSYEGGIDIQHLINLHNNPEFLLRPMNALTNAVEVI